MSSKPGAPAVACYLHHSVLGLHKEGHGALLGEASFTCRRVSHDMPRLMSRGSWHTVRCVLVSHVRRYDRLHVECRPPFGVLAQVERPPDTGYAYEGYSRRADVGEFIPRFDA